MDLNYKKIKSRMFIAVCLDNYITLPYTIKSKKSIIVRYNNDIFSLLMLTFIHHSFYPRSYTR